MRISAAIITFNEEDRLGDCLKSLRGVADEIVILDSFSTDQTARLAVEFGAKFSQQKFSDYASQRNRLLKMCGFDWVLTIDADERLSEELRQELLELKKGVDPDCDGFLISRRSWYLDRWIYHCGWYPQRKVRLFRKAGAHWQGKVHERLLITGRFRKLGGEVLHYTYRNVNDQLLRINRYAAMQAEELLDRSSFYLLGSLLIKPGLRFIRDYLFKLGFLDGLAGLAISRLNAYGVFQRYLLALEKKLSSAEVQKR